MNKALEFYKCHRGLLKPIAIVTITLTVLSALLMVWSYAQFHNHPTASNGFNCSRDHIYLPERLNFRGCKTVTGLIVSVKQEPDGDYHALMRLDVQYLPFLTIENLRKKNGNLVVEDVCHYHSIDKVAKDSCENYHSPFPDLVAGKRYEITGNYVLDRLHGNWAEIHGLSEVKLLPGP